MEQELPPTVSTRFRKEEVSLSCNRALVETKLKQGKRQEKPADSCLRNISKLLGLSWTTDCTHNFFFWDKKYHSAFSLNMKEPKIHSQNCLGAKYTLVVCIFSTNSPCFNFFVEPERHYQNLSERTEEPKQPKKS